MGSSRSAALAKLFPPREEAPPSAPSAPDRAPSQKALTVLMDSGAYTAWRSGQPIDLDAYCRFLKANEHWIGAYAALDVISPGRPEEAASASMDNYKRMRALGLRPVPIFHVGEDVRWLKEMLDLGADYIGLSASSIVTRGRVDPWYDMIWEHLCAPDGSPLIKAHAFGEGREGSLNRCPWYSADTATWLYAAQRAGIVRIAGHKLWQRHDKASTRAAQDVEALEGDDLITWRDLLQRYGIKESAFDARNKASFLVRSYMTARHYLEVEARVTAIAPVRFRGRGMLCAPFMQDRAPVSIPKFNFHLVIGNNPTAAVAAYVAGATHVLASYAHLPEARRGKAQHLLPDLHLLTTAPEEAMQRPPYSSYFSLLTAQLA